MLQATPKISCRHLWKIFGTDPVGFLKKHQHQPTLDAFAAEKYIGAVRDVSFDVMDNEILVIMGLSGSGKSTLIRAITRLHDPTAGEVMMDGKNLLSASPSELIEIRRHKMGMVFQNFGLLPHRNVIDNVAFPLEVSGMSRTLRDAKAQGQTTIAIVNVPESSIAREADINLPTYAGPEIGVASTKAFTCQLAALAAFAIAAGGARGNLSAEDEKELCACLLETPRHIAEFLKQEPAIKLVAMEIAKARDVLYMGRGPSYPLALEGALKLKEISYIHAEGYAAGEMKHGPIALIDEAVPIIVIAPHDSHFEKTISNMQEVMARGGKVLLISDREGIEKAGKVWASITLPTTNAFITPLLYAIPVQLLAYYAAIAKGTDVDQPRNLAKSVTVE